MDESTLFWKMSLNKILNNKQSIRRKYEKAWININFIYNTNEFHKLEP